MNEFDDLVARCIGPERAPSDADLQSLFEVLYPCLKRAARRYCRNEQETDDLVQNTVIKILQKRPIIKASDFGSFTNYCITMAKRLRIEEMRKTNSKSVDVLGPEEIEMLYEAVNRTFPESRPSEQTEVEIVMLILKEIGQPCSDYLIFRHIEHDSIGEIAHRLGKTKKAVSTALNRCRVLARKMFLKMESSL